MIKLEYRGKEYYCGSYKSVLQVVKAANPFSHMETWDEWYKGLQGRFCSSHEHPFDYGDYEQNVMVMDAAGLIKITECDL